MPKSKKQTPTSSVPEKRSRRPVSREIDYEEDNGHMIMLPNADDSGDSDGAGSDSEDANESFPCISYREATNNYSEKQKKLEESHEYSWIEGEKKYSNNFENEILLTGAQKTKILGCLPVEIFELFFSISMKNHIIEATKENGYDITIHDLNTFIGIIVFSSLNERKSQRDYWSLDPYLGCEVVSAAMSRNKFESIKSHLKYSKVAEQNPNDRGWKVRFLLTEFRKNIQKFGFFETALSIDEMMAKSYHRTVLKQFIKGKPIRFGIKFWGLCSADGYLLDVDLYYGKNSAIGNDKLANCALGSRVVMTLLQKLFSCTSPNKLHKYHLYFDNFFTSFDLQLHLQKLGLRSTGTIRENRVKEKNIIDKKSSRGTYTVKHDENSGINYITVMYSKQVSIASTAAGVTPLLPSQRYSSEQRAKVDIAMPNAFHLYNRYMGGVDLHDGHCNNVMPFIRSKKWTWVIFTRFIQSATVNSVVLFNASNEGKKVGSKEFCLSIAKHYMEKGKMMRKKVHTFSHKNLKRICSDDSCSTRTQIFCDDCDKFFCKPCSKKYHP